MTILSALNAESEAQLAALADELCGKAPAAAKAAEPEVKKYVCKICGYVHEGRELPTDFVCPLCRRGAEDFEKLN